MIATFAEILFAALLLFGVWHREKLIAFEDEIETLAARKAAEIVRRCIAMIFFVERNHRGAWVVYGSEGVKQYYGYTKKQAVQMYKESSRTLVNEVIPK